MQFVTVQCVPRCRTKDLADGITRVMQLYGRGSFGVQTVYMDGEFEKIKDILTIVVANITAKNEHISEIER